MKRLTLALAVLVAAACGKDETSIGLFSAAPDTIALGDSTQLVFSADPGAKLSIDQGVGDVTGKTSVAVSPAATTTYALTATKGGARATARATVTVGAARPSAFTVTQSGAAVAGAPASFTISAVNPAGAVNASYRGTVHFTSDDAQATLPADLTFTAADAGAHSVSVTFKTAGARILVATDTAVASARGLAQVAVSAAAPSRLSLSGVPDVADAGDRLAVQVSALDAFGNVATGFAGTVRFSSTDAQALLPANFTFTAADKGTRSFPVVFGTAGTATVTVSDAGGALAGSNGGLTVRHGPAAQVTLEGVPSQVIVDSDVTVTVTVRDAFRNPVTDYAGTLHFLNTDGSAAAIPDATFVPAMQGTKDIIVQFATAGDQSILAADAATPSLAGSTATVVKHGAAAAYTLSALPAQALAGEPLTLTITAVDARGNAVKTYAGTAHVSSTDSTDRLPADGGFTNGVRIVSLAFVTANPHSATVSEVGGTISANTTIVTVVPDDAKALAVSGGSTVAGTGTTVTVTAKDVYSNRVTSYAGTVTLTSSDAQATLPATGYTFTGADSGAHTFDITLATAGAQTVTATDQRSISGSGGFTVTPAQGSNCSVLDLPSSAAAGAQVGLRVVVKDAFANVATGYTGTVAITSSDANAQLGAPAAFTGTDAGSRAYSVQLRSAGNQTVTATDTANASITCQGTVTVVPGATLFTVTFPAADAWAGTAVNATVKAQDAFANPVTTYTGTANLTSSDPAITKPASVTFVAADNGLKTVAVTFNTVGLQTLTATDSVAPATVGTGSQNVHGFVYTNPAAGGKVRLVLNTTASNASVVQLDLVSNTSLFAITLGTNDTVRNGAFAAGMNLPLDTTKAGPDTILLVTTAPSGSTSPLVLGSGTQARAAAIANGVLYSGISQKRIDPTATTSGGMRGDVAVRPFPGASSFYYSLRLKLVPGATAGTVFDGQALASNIKFHAAVRDRSGSDVFSNADFAVGKLEVR